jgi:H+/Cl- antiporter ClcA/CBS domain-containing protein
VTRTALPASARRLAFLAVCGALLGLLGGLASYALLALIGLLTNLAFFDRGGWDIPSFAALEASPRIVIVAVLGAFAVTLIARWAPMVRGHGIPETMEAILVRQSRIPPRAAIAKPLSSAIAIGTGGPFGAEGPIIVTGGSLGSLLGQLLPVSPSERKILLASGAAAGMAATFGTPLAAVVLAIELLLFEFSTRAFVPLVVASTVATGVHRTLLGAGPLFSVPPHDFQGLAQLPLYAALGVLCGLFAVVVTRGFFLVEEGFRRLPVGIFWHPVLGALAFSAIALLEPRALGVGYETITDILHAKIAVGALAALLAVKLLVWWIALGSGTSGGTLAPILLVGGAFGGVAGALLSGVAPATGIDPGAFALVSMAATFGAATQATFASMVFMFEVTRDWQILLPLMLACVTADVVAAALLPISLMTERLSRRGLKVETQYQVDVLSTTLVQDVMTADVRTLDAETDLGEARRRLETGRHNAYPVVDSAGRCLGVVRKRDLLETDRPDEARVLDILGRDVVTVAPESTTLAALSLLLEEEVEHLPVVAEGRLVGICTRSDIMRARLRQFESERRQAGWRPGRAGRS